jgi:geranylgeranyl pyrophosphate synthase
MDALGTIYQPVHEELESVKSIVKSHVTDMAEIRRYIEPYFNGEAKYIRPFLALMCAKMVSKGRIEGRAMDKLCAFAAAVEFIHTASLVHDDIMDSEPKRRGNISLNVKYGAQSAVILGDMLYTKAMQILNKSFSPAVSESLLEIVNRMCYGQLMEKEQNSPDKKRYNEMIKLKTGLLMGFSCAGIFYADDNFKDRGLNGPLFNFGLNTGMFYQMVDDTRDNDAQAAITDDDLRSAKNLAVGELEIFQPSIYKKGILEFLDYISHC